MKRRVKSTIRCCIALVLCLGLLLPAVGGISYAAPVEEASSLCEHHPQHTDDCAYREGENGTPCGYKCEICGSDVDSGGSSTEQVTDTTETGTGEGSEEEPDNGTENEPENGPDIETNDVSGNEAPDGTEEKKLQSAGDVTTYSSGTGEMLDGDYAYISEARMEFDSSTDSGTAMRTGTDPFDSDDSAGNDRSEKNNTVRSFDTVNYTVFFKNKVRESTKYVDYEEGKLHFELVLPAGSDKAQFETGSMGWLTTRKEAEYKIYTVNHNGQTCQVLRGSFVWEPSEENPSAIGESNQTLNITIRVLAMIQGETVQPEFTFWMDYNKVPESPEPVTDENYVMVTGSGYTCTEHKEVEYKTITAPEVKVSSAPRYNVQIKVGEESQYAGSFDFDSGNELAQNKSAGVRSGRVQAFGITLQIAGKTRQHGLRGCEIPQGEISFDLKLSSVYRTDQGVETDVSGSGYAPLLWSSERHAMLSYQLDGREISIDNKYAFLAAPFNVYSGNIAHYTCNNGGTWISTQSGDTIHVTVSDYQVDLTKLPSTDAGNAWGTPTYYDPATTSGYWNIPKACFSAGEFWILQPFDDGQGHYAAEEYGEGTFNMTVKDVNLTAQGSSGNSVPPSDGNDNQAFTDDDARTVSMILESPGDIGQYIGYSGTDITNACRDDGKDWSLSGAEISIQENLAHLRAEGMNTAVAYDDLMKFDDAFFEISSAAIGDTGGVTNMGISLLYGAKPDKKGWDHGNLEPNEDGYDDEMKHATADDLIFFKDLQELKDQGYICVAVLMEARGMASAQSTEIYFTASGKVKEDAPSGSVYMVTHSGKGWNKRNVQTEAAEYLGKDAGSLTDKDYISYAKEKFPSRAGKTTAPSYETDYPGAFWTNDTEENAGLENYKKSVYDKNGFVDGTAGRNFGDSCLVVDYATRITKHPAQKSTMPGGGQQEKLDYDLDTAQHTVDYVLNLSAERQAGEFSDGAALYTTVYVEDILPEGLTYIPYSAYWGGKYIQNGEGKQGTVDTADGGQAMEPEITKNDDGTTTLRWTLENVAVTGQEVTAIDPIYYSCDIDSTKVTNNDQPENTATIWSDKEQKKEFTRVNGNLADMQIRVIKNTAMSLSKRADQDSVEAGDTMGFTMNVGNNAGNEVKIIAMDSLPYPQDEAGSSFAGDCIVTEFTITGLADRFTAGVLKLYYTTDESARGKGSHEYKTAGLQGSGEDWKELSVGSDGRVTLPAGEFKPVAVAAVGELDAGETLKMHVTLKLPEGTSGDRVINRLTEGTLESYGRSYIVGRILEGVVWIDANENGLRESGETMQDGAKVTLMKLKENGDPDDEKDYEPYKVNGAEVTVESGKQFNLSTAETTDYESGGYRFTNLPEGVFGVRFSDGTTVKLEDYKASPANQGEDDTIDSDAVPNYSGEDRLTSAFIPNIVMPSKDKITGAVYTSAHHDLGLYDSAKPTDFTFKKVKAENQGEGLAGAEFKLFALNCEDENHNENDHSALIDPVKEEGCWKLLETQTSDPDVTFAGLLPGEYRLVETKAPAGRVLPSGQWKVVISEKLEITITGIGETKPPAFANGKDGALLLPNMLPADIPGSGGRGTALFTILGILFMGSGAAVYFTLRKRRGGNKY